MLMLMYSQGSNSKIIHLEEDNPNVVNEMLRFLYTGDFLDHPGEFWFGEAVNPLVVDVLVHTIADKVRTSSSPVYFSS